MTQYIDQFSQGYRGELTPNGRREFNCLELCQWYQETGKELFIEAFKQETGNNIQTNPNLDQIVANGIPKSSSDNLKKEQDIGYYRANAFMFLDCMDEITNQVNNRNDSDRNDYVNRVESSYEQILKSLCANAIGMLNHWGEKTQGVESVYSTYLVSVEHTNNIYHAVRRQIFGYGTDFSFNDLNVYSSVAILRTAIELRIRRAFSIYGQRDVKSNFKPLNLDPILKILKKNKDDIDFAIPIENIIRVYKWANIFMHVGLKQYIWSPIFLSKYLKPLFTGKSSIYRIADSGIIVKREVVQNIWNDLNKELAKKECFISGELDYKNCEVMFEEDVVS